LPNSNNTSLISAEALNSILGDDNLVVLDVRGGWGTDRDAGLMSFEQGHIARAIFTDWRAEFIQLGVETNVASVANVSEARDSFRALGINPHSSVVVYDDYHHMQAGRIWWALSHWGFTNVRVLDGGWKHWQRAGYGISTQPFTPAVGSFEPTENTSTKISLTELVEQQQKIILVDARGPKSYTGDPEDPRTGHIPGAINIPYSSALDPDTGCFKSNEALQTVFAEHLTEMEGANIVSSCGSGYAGTVILLALRKLGIQARLFDGSFAEWKQDPARPIEQGPFPG